MPQRPTDLRTEVCDIDDERVAFPVATRIAIPLAYAGRQVRTSVHYDIALPPLPLTHIVEHRVPPGVWTFRRELPPNAVPNSGSPGVR